MHRTRVWVALAVALCSLLSACRTPTPASPTAAQPTTTSTPAPPSGTDTPTSPPGACVLDLDYLEDVTIPDGSVLPPGSAFVKIWRIFVGGTCLEPRELELVFESGDVMGGPASVPLGPVSAGQTLDVSVELTAPNEPGSYRSNWRLRDDTGTVFPLRLYVAIVVPSPTETTTVTPTASPMPSVGPVIAVLDGADHLWFLNPNGDILPPGDMGPLPTRPEAGQAQGLGDGLYYVDSGTGDVMRLALSGVLETVYAPESGRASAFALAADGERLAVVIEESIGGGRVQQLVIVSLAGGPPQTVTTETAAYDPYVLLPVRWTDDGGLLYARQMTGLGGYILFFGYCNLYRYDPATSTTTALIPAGYGPCIGDLSPDGRTLAHICGAGSPVAMRLRDLASDVDTTLPLVEEQRFAGTGQFSPSGTWLAYAAARGDPSDELGMAVVARSDGTTTPQVVATVYGGYLEVRGWLDEDSFIVQQYGPQDILLRANRTGVAPMRLATQVRLVAFWTP